MFDRVIDDKASAETESENSPTVVRSIAPSAAQVDEFGEFSDAYLRLLTDAAAAELVVDDGVDHIPAGLDDMAPGPLLAAILAGTDVSRLSGYDRITFMRAQQRLASHHSAGVYSTMASVTDHMSQVENYEDSYQLAAEAAAAEIRVALRLTRRSGKSEHSFALELRDRLPGVLAALVAGDIDVRRAKTIVRHTLHLSTATAREVVAQIMDEAPTLTTGQLVARLKKLCIEVNPEDAQDRYETAVEERRVVM